MDIDKMMEIRLNAMDSDIKQVFELLLSINSEREFLTRMLFMKKKKNNKDNL